MTMEECVHAIEIFTSATGNFNITTFEHMMKMKYSAIVGIIGFFDNEIDIDVCSVSFHVFTSLILCCLLLLLFIFPSHRMHVQRAPGFCRDFLGRLGVVRQPSVTVVTPTRGRRCARRSAMFSWASREDGADGDDGDDDQMEKMRLTALMVRMEKMKVIGVDGADGGDGHDGDGGADGDDGAD